MRLRACLATPATVLVTGEMVEAVEEAIRHIDIMYVVTVHPVTEGQGSSPVADALRAAFGVKEG